jgi:hypothetical protein
MSFRSVLVVVSLGLVLGGFLHAVWETEAGDIDPWGRTSPTTATPSGDEAGQIDPWGSPGR